MSETDRSKWNQRYLGGAYSKRTHPSALLRDWIDRVPRGKALDIACGAGRNAIFLARHGFDVDAMDISEEGLKLARRRAGRSGLHINWIEHDLEKPLTLTGRYALILIIRYVNLPLIRHLTQYLIPGGYLVCEEHLETDAHVAGPSTSAFRVTPGALSKAVSGLEIQLSEERIIEDPDLRPMALAQVIAQRPE